MMELTAKELAEILANAMKAIEKKGEGEKGRDGYDQDDEEEQPRGYKHCHTTDFSNSKDEIEPNRLKVQGAANFGPYTEMHIRAIARDTILNELKKVNKVKVSKPFGKRVDGTTKEGWRPSKTSEALRTEWARWYDVNEMAKDRKKASKKVERDIYKERMSRKKD